MVCRGAGGLRWPDVILLLMLLVLVGVHLVGVVPHLVLLEGAGRGGRHALLRQVLFGGVSRGRHGGARRVLLLHLCHGNHGLVLRQPLLLL